MNDGQHSHHDGDQPWEHHDQGEDGSEPTQHLPSDHPDTGAEPLVAPAQPFGADQAGPDHADAEPTQQFEADHVDAEPTQQFEADHVDAEPTQQFETDRSDVVEAEGDVPVPVISNDRAEPTDLPASDAATAEHHDAALATDSTDTDSARADDDDATRVHTTPLVTNSGDVQDSEATQQLDADEIRQAEQRDPRADAEERAASRRAAEAAGYQYANYYRPENNQPEPTQVLPAADQGVFGAGAAGFAATQAGHSGVDTETEDQRLARERAEAEEQRRLRDEEAIRRDEADRQRKKKLGVVTPTADETPLAPARPPKRTTDKWFGSLGLFVLRLVTAAILGIRGYQMVTDIPGTRDLLAAINMPYLEYFPWALAIAHLLAALALVFGFGTRVVGLCVTALAVCVLALVKWGTVEIFQSGVPGFVGELEVLLAAVGFTLFTLGGGRWGLDGSIRDTRLRNKYGEG